MRRVSSTEQNFRIYGNIWLGDLLDHGLRCAGWCNEYYYIFVSDRVMEIATLRAIGFSHFSDFIGTIIEAMTLAVVGIKIGSLAAYIFFDGMRTRH